MVERSLRVIPLGGVAEVGKNSAVVQFGADMLVVDAGVKFPEEQMLGVDLVIPDFSYVHQHADDLRAILLTHGHEDHIGAVPYLLKALGRRVPVVGSALTLGLLRPKLEEHGVADLADQRSVESGDTLLFGEFAVEFIAVAHSVPDAMSIAITSPSGTIIFTGDFKFDETPVAGVPTDVARLRELGDRGVLALFSDCVRVETPGRTPSERIVGETLREIIGDAQGRVIFTTFASNITRLQEVMRIANDTRRKVAAVGRSIETNLAVADELGYLEVLPGALVDVRQTSGLPANQVLLVTTGSQGEPTSALARIAAGDHRQIKIVPGDTVIISATPVPGNEETVARTIDNLFRRGALVIYRDIVKNVHVSGHASYDELKEMIALTRPKFCVPIHGEYRHLVLYRTLAGEMGIAPSNVIISDVGEVVELTPATARINGTVSSGAVLVDGLALGVTQTVLRERGKLAEDGILIAAVAIDRETGRLIGGPDLMSRGLVLPDEAELLDLGRETLLRALNHYPKSEVEYGFVVAKIKEVLGKFIYDAARRHPLILPVVTEV